LCVQLAPLYEFIAKSGPTEASAAAAAVQQAVESRMSEYVNITGGPAAYDGPAVWIFGDSGTEVSGSHRVVLTFSEDPLFRIWRRRGHKIYETPDKFWFVSDDGKKITFDGPTFDGPTFLAGGVGYYHIARAFEYVAGPSVDVSMECSEILKSATFLYGVPQQQQNEHGVYNAYPSLAQHGSRWMEWKGVDLRQGTPGSWQPSGLGVK